MLVAPSQPNRSPGPPASGASWVIVVVELTRFDGHGGCVGQAAWVAAVFS